MEYPEAFLDAVRSLADKPYLRVVDRRRFVDENASDVTPGGFLTPYGFWVVATTVGGNAIVISEHDSGVYFADHSSYYDDEISFQDRQTRQWRDVAWTPENVRRSLVKLAESRESFLDLLRDPAYGETLDALE